MSWTCLDLQISRIKEWRIFYESWLCGQPARSSDGNLWFHVFVNVRICRSDEWYFNLYTSLDLASGWTCIYSISCISMTWYDIWYVTFSKDLRPNRSWGSQLADLVNRTSETSGGDPNRQHRGAISVVKRLWIEHVGNNLWSIWRYWRSLKDIYIDPTVSFVFKCWKSVPLQLLGILPHGFAIAWHGTGSSFELKPGLTLLRQCCDSGQSPDLTMPTKQELRDDTEKWS